MLVHSERAPEVSSSLDAWLIWMADAPMLPGKQYIFKIGAKNVFGVVERIHHVVDVNTLEKDFADELKSGEPFVRTHACEIMLEEKLVKRKVSLKALDSPLE